MEPDIKQISDDLHLIATPFRLIRNVIAASLAILFAPAILVLLVIGSYSHPNDCGFAKVLIGVFGPMVFGIWFVVVVGWYDRSDPESELAAYFCGLAWVGILLSLMNSLTGIQSLWAMVAGLFSPAVFYVLGRMFGMWLTTALAILQVGATVFLFGRGFGFF